MRAAAADVLRGAPDVRPTEIVAVGGTASNLLKVLPAAIADRILTRERIAGDPGDPRNASRPPQPPARYADQPVRARLLPAGGAIVDALLDRYGADAIRVSEAGLREGVDPRGRRMRAGLARPPARPRPRLAHLGPDPAPATYSSATTRPSVRRNVTPGDAAPRSARSSAAGARPRARD